MSSNLKTASRRSKRYAASCAENVIFCLGLYVRSHMSAVLMSAQKVDLKIQPPVLIESTSTALVSSPPPAASATTSVHTQKIEIFINFLRFLRRRQLVLKIQALSHQRIQVYLSREGTLDVLCSSLRKEKSAPSRITRVTALQSAPCESSINSLCWSLMTESMR